MAGVLVLLLTLAWSCEKTGAQDALASVTASTPEDLALREMRAHLERVWPMAGITPFWESLGTARHPALESRTFREFSALAGAPTSVCDRVNTLRQALDYLNTKSVAPVNKHNIARSSLYLSSLEAMDLDRSPDSVRELLDRTPSADAATRARVCRILGWTHFRLGNDKDTIALVDQATATSLAQFDPTDLAATEIADIVQTTENQLRLDESNPILWFKLGLLYYEQFQLGSAGNCFKKASDLNRRFTSAWIGRALVSLEGGKHDTAEQQCSAALEQNQKLGSGYFLRAVARYRMRHFDDALADYARADELLVDSNEPCLGKVLSLVRLGRSPEAYDTLQARACQWTILGHAFRLHDHTAKSPNAQLLEWTSLDGQSTDDAVVRLLIGDLSASVGLAEQSRASFIVSLKLRSDNIIAIERVRPSDRADLDRSQPVPTDNAQLPSSFDAARLTLAAEDAFDRKQYTVAGQLFDRALKHKAIAANSARVLLGKAMAMHMAHDPSSKPEAHSVDRSPCLGIVVMGWLNDPLESWPYVALSVYEAGRPSDNAAVVCSRRAALEAGASLFSVEVADRLWMARYLQLQREKLSHDFLVRLAAHSPSADNSQPRGIGSPDWIVRKRIFNGGK